MAHLMPAPQISDALLREAVTLRARYATAQEAANALGIPASTLKSRLAAAAARGIGAAPIVVEKPRVRVPYLRASIDPPAPVNKARDNDEAIYKVLAIGDHHDKPGRDKTRALWIARHAAQASPDAVVSIGDWASLDSLSSHETPGSQNDADRPPFHEDLESLDESLSLFHRELPTGSLPIFHVHGNHEFRANRAANKQPKLNGDMPIRLEQVFARYRWQTRPFGEFLDLYGVDFVHCPLNVMGREVGGQNPALIANKLSRSLVMGHTHTNGVYTQTKYGQLFGQTGRRTTLVNLGTSMPHNVVEKYTGLASNGWGYGVYELRIQGGVILSAKHFDMLELEERYGD